MKRTLCICLLSSSFFMTNRCLDQTHPHSYPLPRLTLAHTHTRTHTHTHTHTRVPPRPRTLRLVDMGGFQICSGTPESSLSQLLLNFAHESVQRSFFVSQGLETSNRNSFSPSFISSPLSSSPLSLSPSASFRCSQQVCACLGDSSHASLLPMLERHFVVGGWEGEDAGRSFNRSCEALLSRQTGNVFRISGMHYYVLI